MTKTNKKVGGRRMNYGNFRARNFREDFYFFKDSLRKGDFTMAGIVLKDFRNSLESLTRILKKMEKEYLTQNPKRK